MNLYNNDCLEVMKDLSANSIDLLFCDLPYGETSCKWDCKIDLTLFWKEINRICKNNCPMFFTTTTRFGVELINSNPKNFRYDLVWIKSASTGFLNAKKMPMRKHEMIYVFYRKLPLYDLSSHSQKFINEKDSVIQIRGKNKEINNDVYNVDERMINGKLYHYPRQLQKGDESIYDPPLPNSVIKEEKNECYGDRQLIEYEGYTKGLVYDPPLPNSIIKEDGFEYKSSANDGLIFSNVKVKQYKGRKNNESAYNPPLPNSILEIKSQKGKHSTQKPTALIEWILKYYSKEGDTVLDPTMGSGSTGIACKTMNRNFIGIEKDEKIYKDAVERLK